MLSKKLLPKSAYSQAGCRRMPGESCSPFFGSMTCKELLLVLLQEDRQQQSILPLLACLAAELCCWSGTSPVHPYIEIPCNYSHIPHMWLQQSV